jgi:septum formation protein
MPTRDHALILASGSPRRRQLLDLIGLPHLTQPAAIDESQRPGENPTDYVVRVARDKALSVAGRRPELPVLAADTVVVLDGELLGKPDSRDHAAAMLRALSGRRHQVHTGIALAASHCCESLLDSATVRFLPLSEDVISWYIDTGEPMDKAGAYAVQGAGGMLVAEVEGSPHTVVGLPIHRLPELFARLGLDLWRLLRDRG